jgi:hypothetical protein
MIKQRIDSLTSLLKERFSTIGLVLLFLMVSILIGLFLVYPFYHFGTTTPHIFKIIILSILLLILGFRAIWTKKVFLFLTMVLISILLIGGPKEIMSVINQNIMPEWGVTYDGENEEEILNFTQGDRYRVLHTFTRPGPKFLLFFAMYEFFILLLHLTLRSITDKAYRKEVFGLSYVFGLFYLFLYLLIFVLLARLVSYLATFLIHHAAIVFPDVYKASLVVLLILILLGLMVVSFIKNYRQYRNLFDTLYVLYPLPIRILIYAAIPFFGIPFGLYALTLNFLLGVMVMLLLMGLLFFTILVAKPEHH